MTWVLVKNWLRWGGFWKWVEIVYEGLVRHDGDYFWFGLGSVGLAFGFGRYG